MDTEGEKRTDKLAELEQVKRIRRLKLYASLAALMLFLSYINPVAASNGFKTAAVFLLCYMVWLAIDYAMRRKRLK